MGGRQCARGGGSRAVAADLRGPLLGGFDRHARWREAGGGPVPAFGEQGGRTVPGAAGVPALSEDGIPRQELFPLLLLRPPRLRRGARRHPGDGQQRGPADRLRVHRPGAGGWRSRHRMAVEAAVLDRQGRDVRHLLGRLQLHPHGDAQPARARCSRAAAPRSAASAARPAGAGIPPLRPRRRPRAGGPDFSRAVRLRRPRRRTPGGWLPT